MASFFEQNSRTSKIGLGLAALGRPGYINLGHKQDLNSDYDEAKMEARTHVMLDKAYELGVRYFDAAQSYGKAETFLSNWLMSRKPKDVTIGSKWGYYYTANWSVDAEKHEVKEHTIERLNIQWPESKFRLDPYLKLYQIHSATFESGVLENIEVLDRLFEIKSEGYAVGLSVSGENQREVIEAAMKIQTSGQFLFDSIQATYNLLERSAEGALIRAHDQGLTVIIKEGLANGRLTSRNSSSQYMHQLSAIAHKHDATVDSIALSYIYNRAFVDIVLSGAATASHLLSNLRSVDVNLSLKDRTALAGLLQTPAVYWGERNQLKWN